MPANRINFTKANIDALPLPERGRRRCAYDVRARGLCMILTARGARTFYVVRKFRGRTERVLIGRYPDTTVEQARRRAGQINSALDSGLNPNELKRQERGELTLNELFHEYLNRHARLHNRRPDKAVYH